MATVPLGEAKDSEYISEVERTHERVTIARHGRPTAMLVSTDDLARLEAAADPRRGGGDRGGTLEDLNVAGLLQVGALGGCLDVQSTLAQQLCDPWRELLVEQHLHEASACVPACQAA